MLAGMIASLGRRGSDGGGETGESSSSASPTMRTGARRPQQEEEQDQEDPATALLSSHRRQPSYLTTINTTSSLPLHPTKAEGEETTLLPLWNIACILSTAFSYGCVMTTLFLITLPVECERIEKSSHHRIPKSVALGAFVAIAGVTQLVSPLFGMLSDNFHPPAHHKVGQRIPYLCLGGILAVGGLLGQYIESYEKLWLRYGIFFFGHMIGLNIIYAMMITLIPDQVPHAQTGVANGILAFLLVTGSLFGFGIYHLLLNDERIQDIYGLYICVVTFMVVLTALYAHPTDVKLNAERIALTTQNGGPPRGILSPYYLLMTMLYEPLSKLDTVTLLASYSIDRRKHHDFFVVTISRLFYYCGISVQTFFLYFVQDIIHVKQDPEASVASLAILGQIWGAVTCYPIGVLSDRVFGGRRTPFVYLACAILSGLTFTMMFARTMHHMTILCSILGAANGMYLTMETSLAVDTLPPPPSPQGAVISTTTTTCDEEGEDAEDEPSSSVTTETGGNAQLLGSKLLIYACTYLFF